MSEIYDIGLLKPAIIKASNTIKDLKENVKVNYKNSSVNLVTTADLRSEEIIKNAIFEIFPKDGIISEESEDFNINSKRIWVIDPLDGTVNYANNIEQVAITVSLIEDGVPQQSIVLDVYNNIFYEGYNGGGAFKNGNRLYLKKDTELNSAIVATGFPYDRTDYAEQYMPTLISILKNTGGVRRFGSAALDVCWIADNKFDAYFEFFIKPWDTLGACLILSEAGGQVIDETEKFPTLQSKLIIASNKKIHTEFKSLILNNISHDLRNRIF